MEVWSPAKARRYRGRVLIDERQQRLAYLAAIVAAVLFVAIQVPDLPDGTAIVYASVGLVLAALLFLAARTRRLVFTAFALMAVSFGPWESLSLLGAPYVAAGGLLMFRMSRQSAEENARKRRERNAAKAAGGGKAGQPGDAGGAGTRKPPPPSKRYTPPKR